MGTHTPASWKSRWLEITWLEYIQTNRNTFEIIGWHFRWLFPLPFFQSESKRIKKESFFDRVLQKHLHLPVSIGCQGMILLTDSFLQVRGNILTIYQVADIIQVVLKVNEMEEKDSVLVKEIRLNFQKNIKYYVLNILCCNHMCWHCCSMLQFSE